MAKQKVKINNWAAAYNKALVNRGSLTFRLEESAILAWYDESKTSSRGRPQYYFELAISTVLMLKRLFRLTRHTVKINCRPRVTLHGGSTRTATGIYPIIN